MMRLSLYLLCLAVAATAQEIRLTQVASGISSPTDIQSPKDGSGRLFFVQQNGLIRVFKNGAVNAQPFLDIRDKTRQESERGLLGLAFPPGFSQSQRFYVDYTDVNGDTIIAQYRVTSNPDLADRESEIVLLKIPQPFPNHNGGQVSFGPDGYLYIAMGDGGSGGDPQNNGQSRNALLGKLLRIDVESEPGRYRIPADNPFINQAGARGEVWAMGLRNPWRFSFDRATRDLWIADVGQNDYEEVNFQPANSRGGENYGWNQTEGLHCYTRNCNTQGQVMPVAEYTHADKDCSVTGGFVYRGRAYPGLRGIYLFGDFCTGRIWGTERQGSQWNTRLLLSSGFNITSFGEDETGELFLASSGNSAIYRVEGSLAPRLTAAGVVNAASFAQGLTPGSLATAFTTGVLDSAGVQNAPGVPLPPSLGGVSVTVGGITAPVQLIANNNGQEQVNFQVPFEIRGRTSVPVVVTRNGQSSTVVNVPVLDVQPAVYSDVVVHNADFTLASAEHPLLAGEFAFVYATGLGQVSNEPATGAAAPASPLAETAAGVEVTIGGVPCPVQFSGLAPGFAGVYQVNFRVAESLASGLQDLVITTGAVASPPVRIAVR
jgi:uncharacterized protein (TIGR03437 family)